jgi:hypothetical protein
MTQPSKPPTVQGDLTNLPPALEPLKAKPNWVMWKWELRGSAGGKKKWTKPPYQPNGDNAQNNNPSTWSSYADCVAALGNGFDGIGFCLLKSGVAAFDVDKCRDMETGELKVQANKLMQRCGPTYTEVTVSGTGIRIIGLGVSEDNVQKKYSVGDGVSVEPYRCTETARFITVSGSVFPAMRASCLISMLPLMRSGPSARRTLAPHPAAPTAAPALPPVTSSRISNRTIRDWPGFLKSGSSSATPALALPITTKAIAVGR